jgi:hypothetical protein
MHQFNFQLKHLYPADLGRLWATLGRREYVESKYRALGSTDLRILEFDVSAHTIFVVLERRVRNDADAVPAWAKIILAGSHVLHHQTRWTRVDSKSAEVEVEIWPPGIPVRAQGRGVIVELSAKRTEITLDFAVECHVPAVGAKVAEFFADQMEQALDQDHRFTMSYLRRTMKSDPRDPVASR